MAFWKVVLIVIAVGILLMALGAWLGYRYISEQDEIRPTVGVETSNTEHSSIHIKLIIKETFQCLRRPLRVVVACFINSEMHYI